MLFFEQSPLHRLSFGPHKLGPALAVGQTQLSFNSLLRIISGLLRRLSCCEAVADVWKCSLLYEDVHYNNFW